MRVEIRPVLANHERRTRCTLMNPANDSRSQREGNMRFWSQWWVLILAGEALVLAAIVVMTSTRIIGENQAGLVIKRYGRQLPSGRIIALDGEAGYQARLLPPGWHVGMWWWRYKVVKVPVVVVQPGEISLVVAADGAAIP